MNLQDFIRVYDNVVSPEICQKIIGEFDNHADRVEKHDTDLYKFNQLNLNNTPELEGLANAYIGSLVPYYEDYFKSLNMRQYVEFSGYEHVRVKKYLKNSDDEFKAHVDVADKTTAVRYLVSILYLNDNNGVTEFPHLGMAVLPRAGRLVVFPPTWMFPHSGNKPTDNDKYIMMTCLHYT
jgi:hypothetical protein